jgi:hypothetical protein
LERVKVLRGKRREKIKGRQAEWEGRPGFHNSAASMWLATPAISVTSHDHSGRP